MGRIPAAVLIILLAAAALAQTPTFRADVRLVRLLVTVKDSTGALIGSLEKDSFEVVDSGVSQTVSVFERTTAQPLSISLLIDTSGSTAKDLKYETSAASSTAGSARPCCAAAARIAWASGWVWRCSAAAARVSTASAW